jgi:hypothetical protein
MSSLLSGLGLKQILPARQTPKLTFFILSNSTEKRKKPSSIDNVELIEPVEPVEIKSSVISKTDDATTPFNWRESVRIQLSTALKAGTKKHFTQDYSEVPPNEFAIQLHHDLVSLC